MRIHNTASIGSISDDAMKSLLDNAKNMPVGFDFSSLGDTIKQVEIPTAAVKAIADSSNSASGIIIETAGAVVSFDTEALNQNVNISIPFDIPEGFKSNGFFVWYISNDGSILNRRPTSYDSQEKLLSFRVHHFSNYVVAYMEPNDVLNCQQDSACPLDVFSDLYTEEWSHDGIHYVLSKELMVGMAAKQFEPSTTVSRAMVAQILYANAGKPDISGETPFTDVEPNAWYAKAIAWTVQNGSVAGYTDGTLRPDRAVTREELAVMLYGLEKPYVAGTLETYPDQADVSDWARNAVLWATQEGIITGTTSGSAIILDPKANGTRAQLAVMIRKYIER